MSQLLPEGRSNCHATDASAEELYFDQGRPDFAQARDRCARAVSAYNNEYVEATKAKRAELWLEYVA